MHGVRDFLVPIVLLAAGIVAGLIGERIVMGRLKAIAARTTWRGDEIVVGALRGMVFFWCAAAGLYGALLNMPVAPSLWRFLRGIVLVVVILSTTVVIARMAGGWVRLYSERMEGILPRTSIFVHLTRAFVFLIGGLVILQSLGISITPLLTALGVGGLAVALALQDTLANLFAGLHILLARQVRPGDYVRLETGEEGYVTDITWRNTTIRTLPNTVVVVPNAKLASAIVTNFHLPEKEVAVIVPVGVSYESDLEKVEEVTVEVAREVLREVPGSVREFDPFVRSQAFGDSSITFTVVMRAQEAAFQPLLRHEFIKRLHRRYAKEGIEIPFPIRTIHLKGQGTATPLPPSELQK